MSFGDRFLRCPDLFPARRAGELSGDRELLVELPGGPYVFSGLCPSQQETSYPLRAICRLEKGPANLLRPMSAGESLATLVACAPHVNHDPYRRERLFSNLEPLLRSVPTYATTSLAGGFWDLLEEVGA
jgi:hypothetical protein